MSTLDALLYWFHTKQWKYTKRKYWKHRKSVYGYLSLNVWMLKTLHRSYYVRWGKEKDASFPAVYRQCFGWCGVQIYGRIWSKHVSTCADERFSYFCAFFLWYSNRQTHEWYSTRYYCKKAIHQLIEQNRRYMLSKGCVSRTGRMLRERRKPKESNKLSSSFHRKFRTELSMMTKRTAKEDLKKNLITTADFLINYLHLILYESFADVYYMIVFERFRNTAG